MTEQTNVGAPRLVTIPARPAPLQIDLARTAVIVVDMQNAFLSPGGMFDEAGYDISGAPACIANNALFLPALRAAGVKIVYLKMSYSKDYSDSGGPGSPNYHKELGLALMQARPEKWGCYVTEGTWDEEVVTEITPQPGDIVVRKQRYSGFAGTNLDMISEDPRHPVLPLHGSGLERVRGDHASPRLPARLLAGYGVRRMQQLRARAQPARHRVERGARLRVADHDF